MYTVNSETNLRGRILVEDPEHGHLRCNSFTGACRGPQQDVGVGVIQRVEDLSLDGVEVSELVQTLVLPITKSCHWQRLQVQQLWNKEGHGRRWNKIILSRRRVLVCWLNFSHTICFYLSGMKIEIRCKQCMFIKKCLENELNVQWVIWLKFRSTNAIYI